MLEQLNLSLQIIILQTKLNLPFLLYMQGLLWGVLVITTYIAPQLLYLGIIPRKLIGLPGIFISPFLHANFNHLFFNSIPLFILSDFILIQGLNVFLLVTLSILLISGFLTWCFGHSGIHIGASGIIMGYFGFLICDIWTQGTLTTIIVGVLCFYYFGGILAGIFPTQRAVSWEGHLFGLIGGMITSYGFFWLHQTIAV